MKHKFNFKMENGIVISAIVENGECTFVSSYGKVPGSFRDLLSRIINGSYKLSDIHGNTLKISQCGSIYENTECYGRFLKKHLGMELSSEVLS